jgi:hypothetical protein
VEPKYQKRGRRHGSNLDAKKAQRLDSGTLYASQPHMTLTGRDPRRCSTQRPVAAASVSFFSPPLAEQSSPLISQPPLASSILAQPLQSTRRRSAAGPESASGVSAAGGTPMFTFSAPRMPYSMVPFSRPQAYNPTTYAQQLQQYPSLQTRFAASNTPLSASPNQSEASLSAGASAGHGETLSRTSTVSVNVGSPSSGHLSTSLALLTQGAAVASVPPGMPHLYLPHLQHRLMMEPSLCSLQQSQQSAFMPVTQKPPQSSQPKLVSSPSLINSNVRQTAQMGLHAPLLSTTPPSVDMRQQQQQHQQQGLWCVGPLPHSSLGLSREEGKGA